SVPLNDAVPLLGETGNLLVRVLDVVGRGASIPSQIPRFRCPRSTTGVKLELEATTQPAATTLRKSDRSRKWGGICNSPRPHLLGLRRIPENIDLKEPANLAKVDIHLVLRRVGRG